MAQSVHIRKISQDVVSFSYKMMSVKSDEHTFIFINMRVVKILASKLVPDLKFSPGAVFSDRVINTGLISEKPRVVRRLCFGFSPTRPPIHWSGIRSTLSFSPVCSQTFPNLSNRTEALKQMPRGRFSYLKKIQSRLSKESEDCLHLNLYVPYIEEDRDVETKELFPIMVFIHGESYSWGSGNLYDGRVLASYGRVIVITFNYRLGVFGFLNTNVSPHRKPSMANYGLMDQIALLKWIQENVRNFGGDPNRVTLFGHKYGAACIQFLMQSPVVVPGLFHRAILMSGSAMSDWALVNDPVHYAVQLSAHLNCTIPRNMLNDHLDIITCLRQKRIKDLAKFNFGEPSFFNGNGTFERWNINSMEFRFQHCSNAQKKQFTFIPSDNWNG
nr:neuroligin-4, X-linked-like [Lepeophtheirus salmonis]